MLRAGGVEPVVLGFRREPRAPAMVAGAPAVDLGRTHDGRLGHRAAKTVLTAVSAPRLRDHLRGADVVMARTLEMLAVAEAARSTAGGGARLVYECLDIHRLMLDRGAKGRALRGVERALLRRADLLVVSSPAFLDAYFRQVQGLGETLHVPSLLVENKVLDLQPSPCSRRSEELAPGPPWRIGWMGAIRCRRSLAILADLATRRPDLVEVRIHGRPAYTEFDDFDRQVRAVPNLTFGGAYTAADLPRLYGEVHFGWAIDYMEEGLNSSWLLPNRLYEASRHGVTPIALKGVQTGRYLEERGFGLTVDEPAQLESLLDALSPAAFARLRARTESIPQHAFVADAADCRRLVDVLAGRRAPAPGFEAFPASAANEPAGPEHSEGATV